MGYPSPVHNLTRSRRGAALAISLGVAGSLLAGCSPGKNGSAGKTPSPSPTAEPLTRDAYVEQATAICQANNPSDIPRPNIAADFVAGVKAHIAGLKAVQAKLRELTPPPADKEQIEENFLTPRDKQIAALENVLPEVQKVAATGDLNGALTAFTPGAQEAVRVASQSAAFTDSFGLQVCAL